MRGLLIVNLGSPDSPSPGVRARSCVTSSPILMSLTFRARCWLPILHGIVLRTRPASSGAVRDDLDARRLPARRPHPQGSVTCWRLHCFRLERPLCDDRMPLLDCQPNSMPWPRASRETRPTLVPAKVGALKYGSILAQIGAWKDTANGSACGVLGQWPAEQHYVNWYADQIAHTRSRSCRRPAKRA